MRSRPSYQVVGIHGVPRSGTSWLGQIFNSHEHVAYRYQPLFSYAFKGRLSESSEIGEIQGFFDELLLSDDNFILQRGESRLANRSNSFRKGPATHLVYKEVRYHHILQNLLSTDFPSRIIGIVRDPVDVIASWVQAPKEFSPEWNILEEWRFARRKNQNQPEEFFGFEAWKWTASKFLSLSLKYPDTFFLLRYESLASNPRETIAKVFQFCQLEMTPQVEDFLSRSTEFDDQDPYGVHRPPRYESRHRKHLPGAIISQIQRELENTSLAGFLKGI